MVMSGQLTAFCEGERGTITGRNSPVFRVLGGEGGEVVVRLLLITGSKQLVVNSLGIGLGGLVRLVCQQKFRARILKHPTRPHLYQVAVCLSIGWPPASKHGPKLSSDAARLTHTTAQTYKRTDLERDVLDNGLGGVERLVVADGVASLARDGLLVVGGSKSIGSSSIGTLLERDLQERLAYEVSIPASSVPLDRENAA